MSKDMGGEGVKLGLGEPVVCSERATLTKEPEAIGVKHIPASSRPTSASFSGVYYLQGRGQTSCTCD